MNHILIPHLRILPFSQGSFYQWTHRYFSVNDNIQGPNISTHSIFIINTKVINYLPIPYPSLPSTPHKILLPDPHWLPVWHHPHALTAHPIRPVEARWLAPPPVEIVSQPHPHATLYYLGAGWARRSALHAVSPPVVGARLCPGCCYLSLKCCLEPVRDKEIQTLILIGITIFNDRNNHFGIMVYSVRGEDDTT